MTNKWTDIHTHIYQQTDRQTDRQTERERARRTSGESVEEHSSSSEHANDQRADVHHVVDSWSVVSAHTHTLSLSLSLTHTHTHTPRASPFNPLKVIGIHKDRSATYDFLSMFHNNYSHISLRFRDKWRYLHNSHPLYLTPEL